MSRRQGLAWVVALTIGVTVWFMPSLLRLGGQGWLNYTTIILLTGLQTVLALGIPALILLWGNWQTPASLKDSLKLPGAYAAGLTMLSAVTYTLVGAFIAAMFYSLLEALGIKQELPQSMIPQTPGELALAIVVIAGLVPFCEELLFRLAIPAAAPWRMPEGLAMLLSAILFAALHMSVPAFPAYLLFGLFAHRLKTRHGTLALPILFHSMYNFSVLVINYTGSEPGMWAILLSAALFVICARALAKGDGHEMDSTGL